MDVLRFELPYPPSINHYYIRTNDRVVLGPKGTRYRHDAGLLLHRYRGACKDKRLAITINVFPPDKRKRDLDNVLKCVLDSLEYAQVFEDDNQIDMLTVIRRSVVSPGHVAMWIIECLSND